MTAADDVNVRQLPSLKLLITLIVVVPIAIVSTILVIISVSTSRGVAEQLASEIVSNATRDVASEVREFLGDAMRISDLYERRLRIGALPDRDLQSWEPLLIDDILSNPRVASICFGNTDGDTTWLLRAHGRLELGRVNGPRDNEAIELEVDSGGRILPKVLREYRYDPRLRPWYSAALSGERALWTPIYFWFGEQGAASETGTGYTRAIRSPTGELRGVLVVDVTLGALSDFLRRLPLADTGYAFIVDDQNLLVAASVGNVNTHQGQRMPLSESDSAAARAVAPLTSGTPGGGATQPGRAAGSPLRRVDINGAAARAKVTHLHPYPGISWRIITVLPESSFLARVNAMQRRSIVLAVLAVAGGLLLGLILSRKLSGPLLQLSRHVGRVGRGEFDARLDLRTARELHTLSEEINTMAGGLKQRMQLEQSLALATHVQQSLLPESVPKIAAMDVAGQSRYCDSTGGDYFDFIDVSPLPGEQVLVAVGDVMGHGIGAALLMATARAAVRASAAEGVSLGELMSRVNRVLSQDARHGLFMTLALVIINTRTRAVRWASAGHDPVIVYDPACDQFQDLDGGDIPLGVLDDVPFAEFHREQLVPGSILVAGTDGIWEAHDPSGEMYGKDRLRELIRRHANATAEQLAAALEKDLAEFIRDRPLRDDVTFVIMKLRNSAAEDSAAPGAIAGAAAG